MRRSRTLIGAGALLAAATLLAPAALIAPAGASPAGATHADAKRDRAESVLIHVDSVSPSTPTPTTEPKPLTVTLTVTNTTSDEITDLQILGERGDPIGGQAGLDAAIENPVAPTAGLPIPSHPAVSLDLAPSASTTVVFSTTTSTIDDNTGICICANADQPALIYPLFFTAHQVKDGIDNLLGLAATYLPIFYDKPAPVRVSWLWPLLDRPHRFTQETVFTDDSLAESVGSGRLSRALAVVEAVGADVPITLLIDPDLLDELEVMATEPYTVLSGDGKPATPGVGQAAASAWLDRLRTVLLNDPDVTVELTPYADPDVETLTTRDLPWTNLMPTDMAERVTDALSGRPLTSTLAWPVTGDLSKSSLRRLTQQGFNTFVLNASAVRADAGTDVVPPRLVRLEANGQTVAAALLSPVIQRFAARAITDGGDGVAAIPPLIAELAARTVEEPDVEHSVTIAAPRYVDPDVSAAVRTIQEVSESYFATPIGLSDAVVDGRLLPSDPDGSLLAKPASSATATVPATIEAAGRARDGMKLIRSLLDTDQDPDAAALVSALPTAIQRAESSAWRDPDTEDAAAAYADLLNNEFDRLATGVEFVGPSSGSYTLASNNSPLPITISNTLPYTVRVRVEIVPLTPGFTWKPIPQQTIEQNTTRTVNIPSATERSGLFKIAVVLNAPNGKPVGEARTMQVRSTALGVIGVIIMIVAGTVLGVALLWRVVRRMRNRKAPGTPPADPVRVAAPEPVS